MYVYVLKSEKDGSFYVGKTNNMPERIRYHNKRYNPSTKTKVPWKLIRIEKFSNASLASKRERFLKTGRGREVIKSLCCLK